MAAFYPLDEPFHNGHAAGRTQAEMKRNLETIISTIKQRFPQTPTAVIFAAPTIKGAYGAFVIPTGYDWLGVDCYGDFDRCGDGSQSVPWYFDRIRDKLNPAQRMISSRMLNLFPTAITESLVAGAESICAGPVRPHIRCSVHVSMAVD